jgi:hypothetical protein
VRIEKKDIAFLIPATLLAVAGLGPDDLWVVGPCLFLSWAAFLVICIIHEGPLKSRVTVAVLITLFFIGVGFRRVAPLIPARKTESKLEYNRIDVFKNYSFVAPDEKLGFKIIVRNTSNLTASLTRFVIVTAIAKADNAFIPDLIGQLEQAVTTAIKEPPVVKGGDVPPGRETSKDTVITLEPDQARGLNGRNYEVVFSNVVGMAGIRWEIRKRSNLHVDASAKNEHHWRGRNAAATMGTVYDA